VDEGREHLLPSLVLLLILAYAIVGALVALL
jgi:hypothetical protein